MKPSTAVIAEQPRRSRWVIYLPLGIQFRCTVCRHDSNAMIFRHFLPPNRQCKAKSIEHLFMVVSVTL